MNPFSPPKSETFRLESSIGQAPLPVSIKIRNGEAKFTLAAFFVFSDILGAPRIQIQISFRQSSETGMAFVRHLLFND